MKKKFFLIKNKTSGRVIGVPEEILNELRRQSDIEVLGEISEIKKQENVEKKETNEEKELKCPICGKVCENIAGLKSHLRLAHKMEKF